MARIENKHLEIFAQNASNNGVFGSAADNSKILSNDIETIQSKPAWLTGWLDATVGTRKFPTLEEFQACNYVNTTMIAYIIQEGIPEWNEDKTYYQNSVVKRTGTYEIYGSVTDDNQGNALTDEDNWELLQDLSTGTVPDATTLVKGIAALAEIADVISGDNEKIVTPDLLKMYGFQTGDAKIHTGSSLQDGWVWAAGNIGSASSGATGRANADCEELFKFYWDDAAYNYTGATATGAALQVFNSSGTAVAKGASADADWSANRRINVPDMRDRVVAGRGDMVGNAGRLSGQSGGVTGNGLGNVGGLETHSLSAAQNGAHTHVANVAGGDGPGVGAFDIAGPGQPVSNLGGLTTSGEGSPHNNVQPTIILNYIIKL
jgi:hypothetical protein